MCVIFQSFFWIVYACSKQIKNIWLHITTYSIIALKIYEQTLENAISEQNNTCLEKTVIFQIVHFFAIQSV